MKLRFQINHWTQVKNFYFAKNEIFWALSAMKFLSSKKEYNLTIVTGSDSSHFKSLKNLLSSINFHEPNCNVVIWDLGLTQNELNELRNAFSKFKIKKFLFTAYPKHVSIKSNYAWKPALINEEFKNQNGLILYLDAGDILIGKLTWIKKFIASTGFFSPYSPGKILDWTHPLMIKELNITNKLLSKPNLNGAIIGFDTSSKSAGKLIADWFDCAMTETCISPKGSDRYNHRYDQASLTCLAYLNNLAPRGIYPAKIEKLGILIHQDVD